MNGQHYFDNTDYSRDFVWLGIRRDFLMLNKYPLDEKMEKRLDNDYKYHAPKDDQQERYVYIRDTAKQLALVIAMNVPPSREQSAALTLLEQAVMEANAGIARNE